MQFANWCKEITSLAKTNLQDADEFNAADNLSQIMVALESAIDDEPATETL